MNDAARIYAALYAPASGELITHLPAIAEHLQGRFQALAAEPSLKEVDALIAAAAGLPPLLMKLRAALEREADIGGAG